MPTRSPLFALVTLLALAAANGHALVFGWVSDRSGAPLAGVSVRQALTGAVDTTDAQGAWSLGSVPVGVSETSPAGASVLLRGDLLRVDLREPSPISVEGLSLDGRRLPVLEVRGLPGTNEFVLPPSVLRPGGLVRVRTDLGAVVLSTSSSAARGPGKTGPDASRAAAVLDTLVFEKVGFETVRRPMTAGQDTFLVTLDAMLVAPTGLQSAIVSTTANSVFWTAVSGATSYEVRRCSYAGTVCTDTAVTNPGFVQAGMTPGSILRVKVRALRQNASSPWSVEHVVHRPPAAPLSRGKSLDILPTLVLPGLVQVTIPGWRLLRNVRAYSEATPFQDTLLSPDSTITLRVGGGALPVFDSTWIRVVALDSLGDSGVCRIRVTERTLVVRLLPRDTAVAFGTSRVTLGVQASSRNGIASVTIGGTQAPGIDGVYRREVALLVGRNVFPVVVTDLTGAIHTDSIVVERLRDLEPPKIARTTVPTSPFIWVKSTTVVYTVTDNDTVSSVTINGTAATRSGNTFKSAVALEAGANPIVVVARDRNGANFSRDSINVVAVLKDRDGNSLKFGRMPDGRMWTLQNIQTLPSAASVDASINSTACSHDDCPTWGRVYSWAMAMDLPAACDLGSCRQSDSLSHQGLCPSGWHVPTAKEWSTLVTAAAKGASDSIGMSRLMSTSAEGKWYSWSRVTCEPVSSTERVFSGTNQYGFTLLPSHSAANGGPCGSGGSTFSPFWRATEVDAANAATTVWNGQVERLSDTKTTPAVLRCIAD
jgi:uncharacterized protein (TIGR02145 family)